MNLTKRILLPLLLLLQTAPAGAKMLMPQDVAALLKDNPQIAAGKAGLEEAKAQIEEARSEQLPHLFAQLAGAWQGKEEKRPTYLYTFGDKLYEKFPDLDKLLETLHDRFPGVPTHIPDFAKAGYTVQQFTEAYSAELGFTWLLFSGGATQNQVASKKMIYEGLKAGQERLVQGVTHGALTAYLGMVKARTLLDLAKHYRDVTDRHVEQVRQFYKRGVVAQVDLFQAQKSAAEAQAQVTQAEGGLATAKAALTYLTGRPLSGDWTLPSVEDLGKPALPPEERENKRPELAALKAAGQAAYWGKKAAGGMTAPKLFAKGSLVSQGSEWPPREYQDWKLALALRWDFGDSGKSAALKAQAEAKRAEAEAKLREAENKITLEQTQARLNFDTALSKIQSLEQARAFAAEGLRVAKLRYQNGLGSHIDVLDAMLADHKAESDVAEARLEAWQAALDFAYAQGDPLTFARHQTPIDTLKEEVNRHAKGHR